MAEHRQKAKMRATFLAIKAGWERLADIRSRLPTASSFYPISMMILPKLSRRLLQKELKAADNLLTKNFERQMMLYALKKSFEAIRVDSVKVQTCRAKRQ